MTLLKVDAYVPFVFMILGLPLQKLVDHTFIRKNLHVI